MTTESKMITITMSETAPIKLDPKVWSLVAEANWFDGQHDFQANTVRAIKVREHADGRRVVYGWERSGPGGQYADFRPSYAGWLLAPGDDVVRAIRRVAGVIGDEKLGAECIADLPAAEV